jgi:hypothetical protein
MPGHARLAEEIDASAEGVTTVTIIDTDGGTRRRAPAH